MNKKLYFKICSCIIGSFIVMWSAVFAVFLVKSGNNDEVDIPQYAAENVQKTVQSAKFRNYVARAENGRVAIYEVYTNGFEKLISVLNINLNRLTEQDKESFEQGIYLPDKSALASLIEDFTS